MRGILISAALAAWCGCGNGAPPPARTPATEATVAPRVVRATDVDHGPIGSEGGVLVASSATGTLPQVDSGALTGAERMASLFEALEALGSGHAKGDVRIVQYGDSHTASDLAVSVLRHELQGRFGDGGRGFVSIGKPWKTYAQDGVHGGMTKEFVPWHSGADGVSIDDGCYGLLGAAIDGRARGARAWTHVDAPSSQVEVAYWEHPRGGSFDVFIDGALAGHVATRNDRADSGYASFTAPDAAHDIELRTAGDGDVRVFGVSLDRGQPGVLVDALGINGAQVFTPLKWSEPHFAQQLRRRNPDLVILAYGTNESIDTHLSLSAYEKALVELLGRVSRAVPTASCLLLGPPDLARRGAGGQWETWPRLLDVIDVQKKVAVAAGCAYYDQLQAMGGLGTMAAWAAEAEPRGRRDHVHFTRAGYTQLGTSFAADLLHAYDAWRLQPRKTWGLAAR